MGKLNPFPTTKGVSYPHWVVEGRRYDDYETARAFAEKKFLDCDHSGRVVIMQKEDRMSPAFVVDTIPSTRGHSRGVDADGDWFHATVPEWPD